MSQSGFERSRETLPLEPDWNDVSDQGYVDPDDSIEDSDYVGGFFYRGFYFYTLNRIHHEDAGWWWIIWETDQHNATWSGAYSRSVYAYNAACVKIDQRLETDCG